MLTLRSPSFSTASVREASFFPDESGVMDNATPQRLTVREGEIGLELLRGPVVQPQRLAGVLTLTDAAGVRAAYLVDAASGGPLPGSPLPLWQILVFATLGGLILDLMPCVFPVLAMKAMAMAKLGGAARGAIRAQIARGRAREVVMLWLKDSVSMPKRLAPRPIAANWARQLPSLIDRAASSLKG